MNKLFFCGDIVLQNTEMKKIMGSSLQKIIKECEVVCGNLEGSVENKDVKKIAKKGPHLLQNKCIIDLLKESGFTVLLGANNHMMDYGYLSAEKTREILYPVELIGFGTGWDEVFRPYVYKLKNQKTVAILSVAESGFGAFYEGYSKSGYARMCEDGIKKIIRKFKNKYDYLFLCCHAGAENLIVPLPEIRELYRRFIDWGVNVVVGSHPHVAQGVENYKNGIIVYSTGNFCFKRQSEFYNPNSIAVLFDLSEESIVCQILPIQATNEGVELFQNEQWKKELDYRTKLLSDEETYNRIVDNFCKDQYTSFYCQTFIGATGNLFYKKLKDRVRSVFYLITNSPRMRFDNIWIKHNFLIETHRWIIMRALKIMEREENEDFTYLSCR